MSGLTAIRRAYRDRAVRRHRRLASLRAEISRADRDLAASKLYTLQRG
jgi:hypothetical protein